MSKVASVETWLPISGLEDAYEVSDHGRVRSLDRAAAEVKKDGRLVTRQLKGRVLALTTDARTGYRRVGLQGRKRSVHHLVLEAFVGPRPFPSAETRHLDGDPAHNWPSNLRWGTRLENAADKRSHGTHNHTQQSTCSRRGHALAGANLEAYHARRGERLCLACNRGYGDTIYWGKQGVEYDRDVLADQYYAWFMEGGPRPRSTPELRDAALRTGAAGWRPSEERQRPGQWTPCVMWVLRTSFAEGEVFSPSDLLACTVQRGMSVDPTAASNAARRSVGRGFTEKIGHGRYRRLADPALATEASAE